MRACMCGMQVCAHRTSLSTHDPVAPTNLTQAADQLEPGSQMSGQAMFITNQQPVPFWGFTGDILEGLGYNRPSVRLPLMLILFVAMLFEYVIRPLLKPIKELSTDFTVFRVRIVATQRAFSCERARRLLGYTPAVSMAEGIRRTCAHFDHLRNPDGPGCADGKVKKK
jgi:plant 3beta-hydroxysteroid-4alpha-carboxylate 3-dehydrogenase